jgi:UDPglucose 6-dehydrogenase
MSFDPMANWQKFLNLDSLETGHLQADTIEIAVKDADVIISLVEWPEIIGFDFAKTKLTKKQWLIDARNQFSPTTMRKAGYHYLGLGRPS